MQKISGSEFNDRVLLCGVLAIVEFYSDSCGPCKRLRQDLLSISQKYSDRIALFKINVVEEPELVSDYRILSVPTLIAIRDGIVCADLIGCVNREALVSWLGGLIR